MVCHGVVWCSVVCCGTEDQPIHHDVVAQKYAWWVDSWDVEMNPDETHVWWECSRTKYNAAMCSTHAPGGMILGMGEAGPVFLGVQRDEVQQVSLAKCKIKGGKVGETFDIVQETEHLVVIKGEQGFMFTGDFKHAGMRHSSDDELLEDLNKRVSAIVDDKGFLG
jgi:hypothetical protein